MSDVGQITHLEERASANSHSNSPNNHHTNSHADSSSSEFDQALQQIRDALRGLRFGNVSIIVQDGVVIQIDRTEKRRVRRSSR